MSALAELIQSHACEPVLLSRAEARARNYSPRQAIRLRELARAVTVRRTAAAELRDQQRVTAALVLYREAITLAVGAVFVARGDYELPAPSRSEAEKGLTALAAEGALGIEREEVEHCRALLESPDPLAPDALDGSAREQLRTACEALLDRLESGYEARSVRELRLSRAVRLGALALAVLAVVGASLTYATRPANPARDRRDRWSSQPSRTHTPALDAPRHASARTELGHLALNEIEVYGERL